MIDHPPLHPVYKRRCYKVSRLFVLVVGETGYGLFLVHLHDRIFYGSIADLVSEFAPLLTIFEPRFVEFYPVSVSFLVSPYVLLDDNCGIIAIVKACQTVGDGLEFGGGREI